MSSAAPMLSVENVSKSFDAVRAVTSASFTVRPGEIFALIGPSGCGKSTTLRMIAGFETLDAGSITLGDRRIDTLRPEERGVGIVFQDYALFPHLTVLDNVLFGLRQGGRDERHARALGFVEMVGLSGLEDRFPNELSGGQQQRVALARTFAASPRLILLDEPFSNLDASLRQSTRREVRAFLKSTGIGAVFVTHDQEEALSFADRVCVMRDGRVEQVGAPADIYAQPRTRFVAGFLGRTNLIRADVSAGMAVTEIGPILVDGETQGGEQLVSIRPEHLKLRSASEGPRVGRIVDLEFKGHDRTYWVSLGDRQFQVDTDFTAQFELGDTVELVQRGPATIVAD